MLTLEQIRECLRDRNLAAVAQRAGISYATIIRLMHGNDVSYRVAKILSDYVEGGRHVGR